MKAKKKVKGTKARVQAYKKRLAYIATAITGAILIAIISISTFLIYSHLNPSPNQTINADQTNNQPLKPKAAIIDHLSLTAPNQTFIQTATNILKNAGYTVDYYPGEEVTVEFYRKLPTHGHKLIILRVHSATDPRYGWVGFFSSEPYSETKYVYEQLTDRVTGASYTYPPSEGEPIYFGITPSFVTSSMEGRFQNTTIVMMGCDGLKYTSMAKALINKGAKAYIGWNELVQASHTDKATTHLLQHLITEKQTIKEAVEKTTEEVGPDPIEKGVLLYYPLEAGNYTIQNIKGN